MRKELTLTRVLIDYFMYISLIALFSISIIQLATVKESSTRLLLPISVMGICFFGLINIYVNNIIKDWYSHSPPSQKVSRE